MPSVWTNQHGRPASEVANTTHSVGGPDLPTLPTPVHLRSRRPLDPPRTGPRLGMGMRRHGRGPAGAKPGRIRAGDPDRRGTVSAERA
jgi:hypothetical protein